MTIQHTVRRGLAALIFLVTAADVRALSPGKSGTISSRTIGGRGVAMGGAQTAAVTGADAVFWNPAALGGLTQNDVSFMHSTSYDVLQQDALHAAFPLQRGVFGAGLSMQRMDIPGYDATGNKQSSLSAADTLATLSWGMSLEEVPLLSDVKTGVSTKLFNKKLGSNGASAALFDAGLLHTVRGGRLPGFTTGLVVQNVGLSTDRLSKESDYPFSPTAKLGFAMPSSVGLTAALDASFITGEGVQANMGLEYSPRDFVSFRVGGISGREIAEGGLTYGLGITAEGGMRLDYAYVPAGERGDSHRMTMGFRFGKTAAGALAPQDATLFNQGLGMYKAGQIEEALEKFKKVLETSPDHAGAQKYAALSAESAAKTRFDQGRDALQWKYWSLAVEHFQKALVFRPGMPGVQEALDEAKREQSARLYELGLETRKSDENKALELWRRALEADPSNAKAKKGVEEITAKRQPAPAPAAVSATKPAVKKKGVKKAVSAKTASSATKRASKPAVNMAAPAAKSPAKPAASKPLAPAKSVAKPATTAKK